MFTINSLFDVNYTISALLIITPERRREGVATTLEDHVKRNEQQAARVLKEMGSTVNELRFQGLLKEYIRLRFLLDDDPFWSDDLDEFAKYSIKKTMERSGDPTKLRDLGINCAGASSSITKRLLLIISLRKGLGIDLDPEKAATAETLGELSCLLHCAQQQKGSAS